MRLKRLHLVNFQDHYSTELNFDGTFNCIVGKTNSGKSSIPRALTFLFYGDWVEDYIANGTDTVTIVAEFDNDLTITRIKGQNENTLILKQGDVEHRLEKIGRALPPQFHQILQLSPAVLDMDRELYLNIANQDDPYFLLTEPGPGKARILGKLAGLHIADTAIRGLSTDRKRLSTEKIHLQNQQEEATKKLQSFIWVSSAQSILDGLAKKLSTLEILEKEIGTIQSLQIRWMDYQRQLILLQSLKECIKIPSLQKIQELQTRITSITYLQKQWQELQSNRDKAIQYKEKFAQELNEAKIAYMAVLKEQKICPLCQTILSEKKIGTLVTNL